MYFVCLQNLLAASSPTVAIGNTSGHELTIIADGVHSIKSQERLPPSRSQATIISATRSPAWPAHNGVVLTPLPIAIENVCQFHAKFLHPNQFVRMFRPIQLAGEGEVVRVERTKSRKEFSIAVSLARPITQIEPYLPDAPN
jgi:hypothetical protein